MTAQILKAVRNVFADSLAATVDKLPLLESAYIGCGRLVDAIPLVRTVYRRGNETLVRKLQQQGQQYRAIKIQDVEFVFDISDFTVDAWFFKRQLFEPATTRFVLSQLKPGDVFVDVGANRGYFTILAGLKAGPAGRVFAFEPNPSVLAELRRHVQLNDLESCIECSDLAMADRQDDAAEFFLSACPTNSGLSSLAPGKQFLEQGTLTESNTIRVRTQTLDAWAEAAGLERPIDLLKIDVEGAEELVVRGMTRLLDEAPPRRIILETIPQSATHRRLAQLGYESQLLDQIDEKFNILFTRESIGRNS